MEHLDSRRNDDVKKDWGDYSLQLDDLEAIECSPFRPALEALRGFGFTEIIIGHPFKDAKDKEGEVPNEDIHKWWVMGVREFPGTESMVADYLGGQLTVVAEATENSERRLQFSLGAGAYIDCNPRDLNEIIWGYLEVIHKTLLNSWEGYKLPIANRDER